MKKLLFFLLALGLVLASCGGDDEVNTPNDDNTEQPDNGDGGGDNGDNTGGNDNAGDPDFTNPPLPDPDDICSGMDDLAFMQYCYNNSNINVNGDSRVSKSEAAVVKYIGLPNEVESIKGIGYFTNLEDIRGSRNLTKLDLSANLKITVIKSESFSSCESLTSVILPNSVAVIESGAFWGCTSLTSVTFGKNLISFWEYAFEGCTGLTSVTIPESVTEITYGTFNDCTSLTSVYCKATTPPVNEYLHYDKQIFDNTPSSLKIYVPTASVDAYKTSPTWSNYADKIVGYDF